MSCLFFSKTLDAGVEADDAQREVQRIILS